MCLVQTRTIVGWLAWKGDVSPLTTLGIDERLDWVVGNDGFFAWRLIATVTLN